MKIGGIVAGADVVVATAVASRRWTVWTELPSGTVPPDVQLVDYDECEFYPIPKADMLTKLV